MKVRYLWSWLFIIMLSTYGYVFSDNTKSSLEIQGLKVSYKIGETIVFKLINNYSQTLDYGIGVEKNFNGKWKEIAPNIEETEYKPENKYRKIKPREVKILEWVPEKTYRVTLGEYRLALIYKDKNKFYKIYSKSFFTSTNELTIQSPKTMLVKEGDIAILKCNFACGTLSQQYILGSKDIIIYIPEKYEKGIYIIDYSFPSARIINHNLIRDYSITNSNPKLIEVKPNQTKEIMIRLQTGKKLGLHKGSNLVSIRFAYNNCKIAVDHPLKRMELANWAHYIDHKVRVNVR